MAKQVKHLRRRTQARPGRRADTGIDGRLNAWPGVACLGQTDRPTSFYALTPAARLEAIDGFLADYVAVVGHVLGDPCLFPWGPRLREALAASITRREVALSLLAEAIGWTPYALNPTAEVEDAAERLRRALRGGAH